MLNRNHDIRDANKWNLTMLLDFAMKDDTEERIETGKEDEQTNGGWERPVSVQPELRNSPLNPAKPSQLPVSRGKKKRADEDSNL